MIENDDDFVVLDDDTLDVLSKKYVGILWHCLECDHRFVERTPSLKEAIDRRIADGCPACGGLRKARPRILLESLLTEEDIRSFGALLAAVDEGIAKIVPFRL